MKLSIVRSSHLDGKYLSSRMQKPRYGPFVSGSFILGKGKPSVIICIPRDKDLSYTLQHPRLQPCDWSSPLDVSSTNLGPRGTVVSIIPSVTSPSAEEVCEAIHRSQTAFQSGVWSRTSTHHRSMTLSRLARSLESRITEFAQLESQQTGRTIREMRAQLGRLPEWL